MSIVMLDSGFLCNELAVEYGRKIALSVEVDAEMLFDHLSVVVDRMTEQINWVQSSAVFAKRNKPGTK